MRYTETFFCSALGLAAITAQKQVATSNSRLVFSFLDFVTRIVVIRIARHVS